MRELDGSGEGKIRTWPSSKLSLVAWRRATSLFGPERRGPVFILASEEVTDESESRRALFMSNTSPEEGATFKRSSGALALAVEEATSEVAVLPHCDPAGGSSGGELSAAMEALRSRRISEPASVPRR